MEVHAGLDVSLERTGIRVPDGAGAVLWRGVTDTHPAMITEKRSRWQEGLVKVGLETGSMTRLSRSGPAGAGAACRGDGCA